MTQPTPAFPPDARPRRAAGVEEQPLGDETLLYHDAGGRVGVLNATAAFIWRRCDGRHTLGDIEADLRAHFAGAGERDLSADVQEALQALLAGGLILLNGGGDAP